MHLIKKLIREELEKVLNIIRESDVETVIKPVDGRDNIIYNYEKGRAFAGDTLEVDISNLNRYHLVEYLPKSINDESWSFEFETVYGTILIVDIKRLVRGSKCFWTMRFGQLYKGEPNPTLMGEVENIEGYENFVSTINKQLANKIDPSKY